jgi:hypothetical protein
VEISVDEVSPMSEVTVKPKKKSSGISASPGRAKAKFKPIRVNVRSLVHSGPAAKNQARKKNLFARKTSNTEVSDASSVERAPRVLSISHQDSDISLATPDILSPVAEAHLDLYHQASSPCILCQICKTYMSVTDFLKHHHQKHSESLVELPQRRKLVPFNKEKMTKFEQSLWVQFLTRRSELDQQSLGVTYPSPAESHHSEEMYNSSPPPLVVRHKSKDEGFFTMATASLGIGETCMSPKPGDVAGTEAGRVSEGDVKVVETTSTPVPSQSYPPSPFPNPVPPSTHTVHEEKLAHSVSVDAMPFAASGSARPQSSQQQRNRRLSSSPSGVRTSSRQRKSKRFFGCENYEFNAGGKKSAVGDDDGPENEDQGVDILDSDSSIGSSVYHLHATTASVPHGAETG